MINNWVNREARRGKADDELLFVFVLFCFVIGSAAKQSVTTNALSVRDCFRC
ncbi:MAG: hypothetical protein LBE13_02150 [Bacteroidales bacterium]|nr:hypothetical protein [Bacteroidales bacterium]